MMNYQKFKGSFWNRRKYVVIALISIGLLALDIVAPTLFPSIFLFFAKPFWNASDVLTSASSDGFFSSKQEVIKDNRELRSRIIDAELRLNTLEAIQQENSELKKMLGRDGKAPSVTAVILARPPFSPYDTFIIDVGSALGVRIGDLATVNAYLVGEVTEVGITYAKVKLFSSPNSKINLLIGKANIQTEAVGQGGGAFIARLPKGVKVYQGDAITMPNFNLRIYGLVEKVVADEADTFQKIYFQSPVNISEVRYVEVERKEVAPDVLE